MTAKQLDLFEYLKAETKTKDPEHLLALLEAMGGIKSKQFNVSYALEAAADLLAGEPERKNTRFNQFVHKVCRAIKPVLMRINRAERVEAVRDAAAIQVFIDDGLTFLAELQDVAEAMA